MGIKINISGAEISGNARVLNNASIRGVDDVNVEAKNLQVSGDALVLENLEINSVLEELNKRVQQMDKNSYEYERIQKILKVKRWNKKKFAKSVVKHLSEFSQGVLASVVANHIGL